MENIVCSNCKGTGKVLYSMSTATGEKEYNPCSVCKGSGHVIADEKAYYSKYPDVSLRNALQLMQKHGKPVQIEILNSEVHILFGDESKYILGGFTVGYRGTGPDFTKRFLNAAGFAVTMNEIEAMAPPVTLKAGGGIKSA